jgi:hypothetical protein
MFKIINVYFVRQFVILVFMSRCKNSLENTHLGGRELFIYGKEPGKVIGNWGTEKKSGYVYHRERERE